MYVLGLLHQVASSTWRESMPEKVIEIEISKATPRQVDMQAERAVEVPTSDLFFVTARRTQSGDHIQSIRLQQARVDHV